MFPLNLSSKSPGGKGFKNTQFPSETALVLSGGKSKILFSGNVKLKISDRIR
jgi:hypothetical protein